jgi:hypothetical protein
MITNYFKGEAPKPKIYEYFEYYPAFYKQRQFKKLYKEVKEYLSPNSTRESCVALGENKNNNFIQYHLNRINWEHLPQVNEIKTKIQTAHPNILIDYGLIHHYRDDKSVINWHSDREALKTPIYSISIGGARKFTLRDKQTQTEFSFTLYDGDLFLMKPGCQDRFEHCIKSCKALSEPRISITFRQIETPSCYLVLNHDTYKVDAFSRLPEEVEIITTIRHCVSLCLFRKKNKKGALHSDQNEESESKKYTRGSSLLKSNLQKAIRRNEKKIALTTAFFMLEHNLSYDLLRRLSIISFEDVTLDQYYPTIVWFMVCTGCAESKYVLTPRDKQFIYSYTGLLCDIPNTTPKVNTPAVESAFTDIATNAFAASLYVRILHGGFYGEKNWMTQLTHGVLTSQIKIEERNIEFLDFPSIGESGIEVLDSAIDFHVFPRMPANVANRIDPKFKIKEADVKKMIWDFDSSVNYRKPAKNQDPEQVKLWENVVRPACQKYRNFIKIDLDFTD